MKDLNDLSREDWRHLEDLLVGSTLTPTEFRKLVNRPEIFEAMLKGLRRQPEFSLIHDRYHRTEDVLRNFSFRCRQWGYGPGQFSWDRSRHRMPEFDPDNHDVAVVLEATLGSLRETVGFAWRWAVDYQRNIDDSNPLLDLGGCRFSLFGGRKFRPWTLRWTKIHLGGHRGAAPSEARHRRSPGLGLLFLAAEHPGVIRSLGRGSHRGFWLPGLEWAGSRASSGLVPLIVSKEDGRVIHLDARRATEADADLSVPTYVK